MKISACLFASLSVIVAPLLSVATQEPAEPLQETRIVLRVSVKFIQGLVGTGFQRDEPIDTEVGGIAVTGTANVTGKFHITLHESKTESEFNVMGRGEVLTQLAATRRPVVVLTHGAAPFSVRQRIVHKCDLFIAQTLTIDVQNKFKLDEIRPYHGGRLTGALTQRIARPFVRRGLAEGDHQADDEIRTRMTNELQIELDKLIVALNKIPPLVKQAYELIILENKPPMEEMRVYRSATKEHLLFSIGVPDRRIPNLPNLDTDRPAPLELWVAVDKNALTEERRKTILANWRLIAPYLRNQLQRRSPELVKEVDEPLTRLLEEVQMCEVAGWHVLTFAPKIPLPAVGPF